MSASKHHHWVFFYGSCISSASRKATGITGAVFPCSVLGYTRHWGARVDLAAKGLVVNDEITGVTAVTCLSRGGDGGRVASGNCSGDGGSAGAKVVEGASGDDDQGWQKRSTNGVLVRVPESSIPSFDEREVNYTRKRLVRRAIVPLRSAEEDEAVCMFTEEPEAPCWM